MSEVPMSDKDIQALLDAIERECRMRVENNLPLATVEELEASMGMTMPEYMKMTVMVTIHDVHEDCLRRARRWAELHDRITVARLNMEKRAASVG